MSPLAEEIIKQEVIEHLTWDNSINVNDVMLKVIDNTVRLSGTVPNQTAKMAAERDAYQVKGVLKVENLLEVEFPPRITLPSDDEITDNIRNILAWDDRVNPEKIEVRTKKGVVVISGTVSSYREKYHAARIILSITGVIELINNLKVIPVQKILDRDIEKDIKKAYRRSILVDEDRVRVNVRDGVACLSGVVSNNLIRQEVVDIAMFTAGVVDVDDSELTIG